MSDRLSPSWRPQREDTLFDPQLKRMVLIAAGVAAVLALAVGGYRLVGHTPRSVPVIEADGSPLRVRPANPGGMQVAGAEETGGSDQAEMMAPPPEAPAPQVLRAEIQAAHPPVAAPLPQAAPLAAPQAGQVEQQAAPPPAIKQPEAAAPAMAKPVPVEPSGKTQVQLAAMQSEALAMAEWQRLAKRMPEVFTARKPLVMRIERDGKALFRLRTGGFADPAQAAEFCTRVKAKGGACAVASF